MKTQAQNAFNRKRFRVDWLAQVVMFSSGVLVLVTFLLVIGHVFYNTVPLFHSPSLYAMQSVSLPKGSEQVVLFNSANGTGIAYINNCDLLIANESMSEYLPIKTFPLICETRPQIIKSNQRVYVAMLKNTDTVEIFELIDDTNFPSLTLVTSFDVSSVSDEIMLTKNSRTHFVIEDEWLFMQIENSQKSSVLWGPLNQPEKIAYRQLSSVESIIPLPKQQAYILVRERLISLFDHNEKIVSSFQVEHPITLSAMTHTRRTLYLSTTEQTLQRWIMFNKEGRFILKEDIESKRTLQEPLSKMLFDKDSNAALLLYDNGQYQFLNRVTAELFSPKSLNQPIERAEWKHEHLYVISDTHISKYRVEQLQGITTLQSLFGKNWYEGYSQPNYAWQTSTSSPSQQAKYSLIPLIMGSLKASLLALTVAIPLSLGAAIYTSFFATQRVRGYLKPSIEMLEAIPSVIIGFIAAVWLTPLAEQFIISILMFVVLVPFVLVAAAILQPYFSRGFSATISREWEIIVVLISTLVLGAICFAIGDLWQSYVPNDEGTGGLDSWLMVSKTTLVVACALGIAISPSIYSIADDALSDVPSGLIKASYSLGSTRLQTLQRIILVVAMPSLISAVMLGFGRAFGETMIVLMVSGNTPVSDWSIFEGLRAMTANLAIELQEAEIDTAHFNILFTTAALLFLFTFVLNTGAELLRAKLRKVVGNGNS